LQFGVPPPPPPPPGGFAKVITPQLAERNTRAAIANFIFFMSALLRQSTMAIVSLAMANKDEKPAVRKDAGLYLHQRLFLAVVLGLL
jgi:hypothetical protein